MEGDAAVSMLDQGLNHPLIVIVLFSAMMAGVGYLKDKFTERQSPSTESSNGNVQRYILDRLVASIDSLNVSTTNNTIVLNNIREELVGLKGGQDEWRKELSKLTTDLANKPCIAKEK